MAAADAAIVARLREAGAIVLGKTRTDELGLGALTPGASDPRDATRSPGGSSGGSAIAVAVGAVPLALATDTAGSARIPAAACGVSGLCAAPDWIPAAGVSILAPSFDRLGLIAATAPRPRRRLDLTRRRRRRRRRSGWSTLADDGARPRRARAARGRPRRGAAPLARARSS